jgi:hypothetical protein
VIDPRREPEDSGTPRPEQPFSKAPGAEASAAPPAAEPAPFEPTTAAPPGEVVSAAPSPSVEATKVQAVLELASTAADAAARERPDSARIRAAAAAAPSAAPRDVRAKTPAAQAASSKTARASAAQRVSPKAEADSATAAGAAERSGEGYGRLIAFGVLAFAGAFAVVHWLVVPALEPREQVGAEITPTPSAAPAPVPSLAVSAAAPAPTLRIEPLAIPAGADPGPSKGFIDVVGSADDQLYVDGTFVGRGPSRSVPVTEGTHEVRIVRGEAAHTTTVTLAAGKRLRVRLDEPSRPGH